MPSDCDSFHFGGAVRPKATPHLGCQLQVSGDDSVPSASRRVHCIAKQSGFFES